eukprot:CAMPEP_0170560778 /NCGR_PEP_ID=MMETSP0211-20121228/50946_1 /TAXON_ID=311385 /ORGANISM="Pseudokeronopsis sp., Strain OXSARD2" /LENGTH=43 /DNA_ID= /DNA_START= /DNA_END= /DNA_ORIENTATION=
MGGKLQMNKKTLKSLKAPKVKTETLIITNEVDANANNPFWTNE